MKKENQKPARQNLRLRPMAGGYIIGVDGGGTKTIAALSDLNLKILKIAKTGPSNLRNKGVEEAVLNISKAILEVIKGIKEKNILSIFIALAAVEEEFKSEKEKIKREILKNPKISKALRGKIEIVSDQVAAFRAGTDEKDGVVLITGTGSVCHGWRGKKEEKTGGWGWANDEGSGFWAGQKGYQAIFKELDGRSKKTKITKSLFKEWKLKNKEDLMKKIYGKDSIRNISLISKTVDKASQMGDKVARKILEEAGEELSILAISVIKRLNFHNKKFPLVLIGAMFKSKIILNKLKKEIKKLAPRAEFIFPKEEPVIGAIKLAIENLKK
jgi:N-acetylglucosamine kinase-like BadF-type ATPase